MSDHIVDELNRTTGDIDALRTRLAERAADSNLLDVAYRTIDSPIGPLLLAATPQGLVRIGFESEDHDAVLTDLADRLSPRLLHAPARLDTVARQLDGYFAGTLRTFDMPVDLQLARGFRRAVLDHLLDIAYGTTESYAAVAAGAGNPKAVRAAGTACGHNPIPVVVPCHRVVRSDGLIGNYRGGTEVKHALLALEAGYRPDRRRQS
jgi:methylated-DNA-[protein]-cysteine S-methyltransferase